VALSLIWCKNNLNKYVNNADMNQLFLSGHSAGAHLATLVTLDRQYLDNIDISINKNGNFIKGCIAVSGIYNLEQPLHETYYHYKNIFFRLGFLNVLYPCTNCLLTQSFGSVYSYSFIFFYMHLLYSFFVIYINLYS